VKIALRKSVAWFKGLRVNVIELHIITGWAAILLSFLSGAVIGLFFHKEDWAGGYGSFSRRMLRLGHISFFGLGVVNLQFGLTLSALELNIPLLSLASTGFIVAVVTMPLCCYLAAWKRSMRLLFPLPVTAALVGIAPLLLAFLPQ